MSYEIFIKGQRVNLNDSGDFPISLKRSLVDATEPTKRAADSSFTVQLINDDAAKLAFGALAMIDRIGTYKQYAAMPDSRVYGGGVILLEGLFYLTKVSETTLEGFFVASEAPFAQLIQNRKMWELQLGTMFFDGIAAVNFLTEILADYDADGEPDAIPFPAFFPLAVWGNIFLPNYWGSDTNRVLSNIDYAAEWGTVVALPPSRPILEQEEWTVDVGSVGHIDFRSLPPAWFITNLIKQIFADAGYAASGPWFGDDRARRTYLLFSGEEPRWNWPYLAFGQWEAGANATTIRMLQTASYSAPNYAFGLPGWDGGGLLDVTGTWDTLADSPWGPVWSNNFDYWRAGYKLISLSNQVRDYAFAGRTPIAGQPFFWTCPADGVYSFDLTFDVSFFENTANPADLSKLGAGITLYPEGQAVDFIDGNWLPAAQTDLEGWNNVIAITEITGTGAVNLSGQRECTKGDVVVCWIAFTHWAANEGYLVGDFEPGPPPFPSPLIWSKQITAIDAELEVNWVGALDSVPPELVPTSALQPAQSLPDISQADFLNSIARIFNLYFEIDERNKRVSIDSINNIWNRNAPRVDVTRMIDRNTVQLLPPNVSRNYAFVWSEDSADYVATTIPAADGVDGQLDTTVQVVSDTTLDTNPLTLAKSETYRLIYDARLDFVNPRWFDEPKDVLIPHIASREGYFTQVNELDPDGFDFAPKLTVLESVTEWSPALGPVARVFDEGEPIGDRDYLTEYARNMRSSPERLYWSNLINAYYRNWIQALAEGHVLECQAIIDAATYNALTLRATVLVDGVDYSVLEVRGFNPANETSKVRLKLARK